MLDKIQIKLKVKAGCEDLPLPKYITEGSCGLDLYADIEPSLNINPGEIQLISTGIHLSIPHGYEAQIRPRSGLALKHGISFVNTPGTIDSDYRGVISVIMINFGKEPFEIKRGDRIAQMVINKIVRADFQITDELDQTARAQGGFGHTGRR